METNEYNGDEDAIPGTYALMLPKTTTDLETDPLPSWIYSMQCHAASGKHTR